MTLHGIGRETYLENLCDGIVAVLERVSQMHVLFIVTMHRLEALRACVFRDAPPGACKTQVPSLPCAPSDNSNCGGYLSYLGPKGRLCP
jgi:hypothetical protein